MIQVLTHECTQPEHLTLHLAKVRAPENLLDKCLLPSHGLRGLLKKCMGTFLKENLSLMSPFMNVRTFMTQQDNSYNVPSLTPLQTLVHLTLQIKFCFFFFKPIFIFTGG